VGKIVSRAIGSGGKLLTLVATSACLMSLMIPAVDVGGVSMLTRAYKNWKVDVNAMSKLKAFLGFGMCAGDGRRHFLHAAKKLTRCDIAV